MVSNGWKYNTDTIFVKEFEKIWIFYEIRIDFRKNSAVIQTSNSEKLTKIIKNVEFAQQIWQNYNRGCFFFI